MFLKMLGIVSSQFFIIGDSGSNKDALSKSSHFLVPGVQLGDKFRLLASLKKTQSLLTQIYCLFINVFYPAVMKEPFEKITIAHELDDIISLYSQQM